MILFYIAKNLHIYYWLLSSNNGERGLMNAFIQIRSEPGTVLYFGETASESNRLRTGFLQGAEPEHVKRN